MKTVSFLLCFLLFASVASSQSEPEFLKTKCLSFNFNGFNLGTIGGGIGGKMWTSNATAYTLSIGGSFYSNNTEANAQTTEGKESSSFVQIQAGFEQHTDLGSGFSPYFAGIAFGSFLTQKQTYARPLPGPGDEFNQTTNSVGAMVGFGVEYWLTKRISVAGQQLFQASYRFGNQTSNSQTRNTSGFSTNLGTSALILSIYF
jgi:hypothetical protein